MDLSIYLNMMISTVCHYTISSCVDAKTLKESNESRMVITLKPN